MAGHTSNTTMKRNPKLSDNEKQLNARDDAKPCPECEQDCVCLTDTVDARTGDPLGHKITCNMCGALGPLGETMHDAVVAWNAMEEATFFLPMDDPDEDDDMDVVYI